MPAMAMFRLRINSWHTKNRERIKEKVGYQAASRAFDLAFDLKRPVKPRWPEFDIDSAGNRHGCRFSRAGPGMALRGGPPNQCRITGMPSLGEGPSGGAQTFWLLLGRLPKVTRCKSGTLISRYRSNGYVHQSCLTKTQHMRANGYAYKNKRLPKTQDMPSTPSFSQ